MLKNLASGLAGGVIVLTVLTINGNFGKELSSVGNGSKDLSCNKRSASEVSCGENFAFEAVKTHLRKDLPLNSPYEAFAFELRARIKSSVFLIKRCVKLENEEFSKGFQKLHRTDNRGEIQDMRSHCDSLNRSTGIPPNFAERPANRPLSVS